MLNPALVSDAVTAVLKNIPALATAMTGADANGDLVVRIKAHHYRAGTELRLAEAVYKMPAPSILVAWERTLGGSFNGQSIWKHCLGVYLRMGNAAGITDPTGYEELWWMICNALPEGSTVNIRYMNILPELDIMDTPSIAHLLDEDQIDIFRGEFCIPEIGDN